MFLVPSVPLSPGPQLLEKKEYLNCCNNVGANQRNMEQLNIMQKVQRYQLQIDLINLKVRGEQMPFRHIPQWDEMEAQFTELRSRYKFFVLEGQSRTGKSSWAFWVFNDPKKVFYVNCAHCSEPDLRKFDWDVHKAILLDEASPQMVLDQRLLMQGPPCFVKLGMSTTNCHAYDAFTSGTRMIICSNTWAEDVEEIKKTGERQWIKENQIYYNTGSQPLFQRTSAPRRLTWV